MAQNIRSLRDKLGMTQQEIASELGVTETTYARWERESSHPKWLLPHLQMLAERGGVGSSLSGTRQTVKDPLHRKILERLNEKIDSGDFELCVVDLLNKGGVNVVLIGGMSDGGFDGAVTMDDSVPAPLIVTTGTDVLRNFKKNLRAAKIRTKSRTVFVATAKTIRPKTRREIEEFAEDNGYEAAQIYDQNWLAIQLYGNPTWCKKLLGVSGKPSALSRFPITDRPTLSDVFVGRESQLQILTDSKEDCLVKGSPGSGKTYLFFNLAQVQNAYFLCDHDSDAIADAIREEEPRIVLVDDAHSHQTELESLMRIRSQTGSDFRIVASSWPSDYFVQRTCNLLKLDPKHVVELPPLSDDQIIQVIEATGIRSHVQLQAMIRQQSQGMPGLAVTLSNLCLNSNTDIYRIASGEALLNQIMPRLVEFIGEDVRELLALFAVGGKAGMSRKDIASYWGRNELDILQTLTNLSEAGIVKLGFEDRIVVVPFALTITLVRQVFFGKIPNPEGYLNLFSHSPEKPHSLMVLVGTHAAGARIPYLKELLKKHAHTTNLTEFAAIGVEEASFVIREFPEEIFETALGFLSTDPEQFLPMLYDHTIEIDNQFESSFSRIRSVIDSWLEELPPSHPVVPFRHTVLISATMEWTQRQNKTSKQVAKITNHMLCKAFEGSWEAWTSGAVDMTAHSYRAVPTIEYSKQLEKQWNQVSACICDSADVAGYWIDTIDLIRQWTYVLVPVTVNSETVEIRKQFAVQIRNDLARYFSNSPGLLSEITKFDHNLSGCIPVPIDVEFQTLFPVERDEREQLNGESILEIVKPKVDQYIELGPEEAAKRIQYYEAEAEKAHIRYPRLTVHLCHMIAELVEEPLIWLDALIQKRCEVDLIKQFVCKSAAIDAKATVEILTHHTQDHFYTQVLLELSMTDIELFRINSNSLTEYISKNLKSLRSAIFERNYCDKVLVELLSSEVPSIRYTAALSFFELQRASPQEFLEEWRTAILSGDSGNVLSNTQEYYLEKLFETDRELAILWLKKHYGAGAQERPFGFDDVATKVMRILSAEERKELINQIDQSNLPSIIAIELIGTDTSLYTEWLKVQTSLDRQLLPLNNPENQSWSKLLLIALEHRIDPIDVAESVATPIMYMWSGSETDMWKQRRLSFQNVLNSNEENSKVTKTISLVISELNRRIDHAEKIAQIPDLRL